MATSKRNRILNDISTSRTSGALPVISARTTTLTKEPSATAFTLHFGCSQCCGGFHPACIATLHGVAIQKSPQSRVPSCNCTGSKVTISNPIPYGWVI